MQDTAFETIDLLEKAASSNEDFNIHPYFHEYTMSIISKIALGQAEPKQFENPYTKILIETLQYVDNPFSFVSWIFPALWPILLKMQMNAGKFGDKGFVRLIENVRKTVHERKKQRVSHL
jgi:cytochrome P450